MIIIFCNSKIDLTCFKSSILLIILLFIFGIFLYLFMSLFYFYRFTYLNVSYLFYSFLIYRIAKNSSKFHGNIDHKVLFINKILALKVLI